MNKKPNIAVIGATGLVGSTILKVMEELDFPFEKCYLFSSKRSEGTKVTFFNKEYRVEELTEDSFNYPIDIALFAAGGATSLKYAKQAASKGILVIDNSSAFRMDKDVPLVVPEVNKEAAFTNKGIIANPNCSTIQAVAALKPLNDKYGIKRIVYSTYQAVSGSGLKGIKALQGGISGNNEKSCYPHPIFNNCIPHIDDFTENGYTKEELKMINETRKILGDETLKITATTVRVPVFDCHSEALNVELLEDFDLEDVKALYKEAQGIKLVDDVENNLYPLPLTAKGTDLVYVGRIRRDFSHENTLNLWVVADNIRKGAATNAVQIAQLFV